jgi:hypothetical protein
VAWRKRLPWKFYTCSALIIDGSVWDRIDSLQDLNHLSSNRFMNRKEDPLIIDSEFSVFEMSQLKMRGSTLGLIFTGPRPIKVEFELKIRRDRSIPDAKEMVMALLPDNPAPTHGSKALISSDTSLSVMQQLEALNSDTPLP